MNSFWAVFKRELKSYFTTPLAYVFLVVFLAAMAHITFDKQGFFLAREANLMVFFWVMPDRLILLVSAIAMRLWAEERKVGSIELLLTLPVTVTQAVLGKFFAAWFFLAIALACTFTMVITVCFLGDPDIGPIITGYVGTCLMAGGYLSIGCFFSAVSKSQVIAFVLSAVTCALFCHLDDPSLQNFLSDFLPDFLVEGMGEMPAVKWLSVRRHFESSVLGVLRLRDISYFVLLIGGWTAACVAILDDRKAT